MGLFDLFKRKDTTALARQKAPTLEQAANQIIHRTETQIREGLSKLTAGTGTQIDKLHRMAKNLAQMANIGGGSKASGGGGVSRGIEIVSQYNRADAVKKTIEHESRSQLKK